MNSVTDICPAYEVPHKLCLGTKEIEKCTCGGARVNCDFYPEIREKAERELKAHDAEITKAVDAAKLTPNPPTTSASEQEPHILDSGDRTQFDSGAVRDMRVGKGRCDLMPLDVVSRLIGGGDPVFDGVNAFQETDDVAHLYRAIRDFRWCRDWSFYDLLLETAVHFEEGALKYGDNNWRKGIPVKVFLDSALRHYIKFLRGDKDEPHDRAVCWNLMCAIWTAKHKPELDDYRKE